MLVWCTKCFRYKQSGGQSIGKQRLLHCSTPTITRLLLPRDNVRENDPLRPWEPVHIPGVHDQCRGTRVTVRSRDGRGVAKERPLSNPSWDGCKPSFSTERND